MVKIAIRPQKIFLPPNRQNLNLLCIMRSFTYMRLTRCLVHEFYHRAIPLKLHPCTFKLNPLYNFRFEDYLLLVGLIFLYIESLIEEPSRLPSLIARIMLPGHQEEYRKTKKYTCCYSNSSLGIHPKYEKDESDYGR